MCRRMLERTEAWLHRSDQDDQPAEATQMRLKWPVSLEHHTGNAIRPFNPGDSGHADPYVGISREGLFSHNLPLTAG